MPIVGGAGNAVDEAYSSSSALPAPPLPLRSVHNTYAEHQKTSGRRKAPDRHRCNDWPKCTTLPDAHTTSTTTRPLSFPAVQHAVRLASLPHHTPSSQPKSGCPPTTLLRHVMETCCEGKRHRNGRANDSFSILPDNRLSALGAGEGGEHSCGQNNTRAGRCRRELPGVRARPLPEAAWPLPYSMASLDLQKFAFQDAVASLDVYGGRLTQGPRRSLNGITFHACDYMTA
eukprot:359359-Chlamydomonas_euryale.AAC.5